VGACSQQPKPPPGQLIVAIDTDMALPDQIDTITLIVSVPGETLYNVPLQVGTGLDTQPIPATMTLVAGSGSSVPVTIQVVGTKNGVARTLRQVTTPIPTDRIATLRMPIQWLCDGTAQAVPDGNGGTTYQSSCGPNATCRAGECEVSQMANTDLPDYQPELVFGGGQAPPPKGTTTGTCFDTIACMLSGTIEVPDDQCSVDMPAGGTDVNVALRVANDGICDTTGTTCFVPLDGNNPDEGWSTQAGRIALPPAVCDKLRSGLVAGVVVSTSCPTKTDAAPACGAWSSVVPASDAASTAAAPDAAVVLPSLLASVTADGGASTACCPLMADNSTLYTCVCSGASPVQVVAIDPTTGTTTNVTSFMPTPTRSRYASVLAGGDVYWVDRTQVSSGSDGGDAGGAAANVCVVSGVSTSGGAGGALGGMGTVNGDIYDGADLLADAANLYALADNVSGVAATAGPVQLLRFARGSGMVTPLDTGGALPVLQFTQDAESVYVGVDTDLALDAGVERVSRILQFPKAGGSPMPFVTNTLTTSDPQHGGFVGLQDDGTTLFALYEAPPGADGRVDTQVLAFAGSDAGSQMLYEEVVDPKSVQLRLLGAVSGAVLLVRDSVQTYDAAPSATESTVLAIVPGAGSPRILASFAGDSPVFELQTPAFSRDAFWLNASGRVFRLPAAAFM
jgi:hypothetical protein